MHEYRRFVQGELDARGWQQADLVKRSGLSRQLVSKILSDDRPHLGQMPDDTTLEKIAHGFQVPVDRVRTAAARSLARYEDDGRSLITDLRGVHMDALLGEIRRRLLIAEGLAGTVSSGRLSEGRPQWGDEPERPDHAVIPNRR